jgi:hypothetical protein
VESLNDFRCGEHLRVASNSRFDAFLRKVPKEAAMLEDQAEAKGANIVAFEQAAA